MQHRPRQRHLLKRCRIATGAGLGALALTLLAPTPSPLRAEDGALSVELNKLEAQGQGCRAYFVINNKSATEYQSMKLDIVLFRPDAVIAKRFAVDLAPLKANKRSVKLFDIEGTPCDQVGNFLINDVMECKTDAGPVADCMKDITVSTLTNVQLTK